MAAVRRSKRRRVTLTSEAVCTSSRSSEQSSPERSASDDDFQPPPNFENACDMDSKDEGVPAFRLSKAGTPQHRRKKTAVSFLTAPTCNLPHNSAPRVFSHQQLCQLRTTLLDWYVDNFRTLPWRAPPRYRKNGLSPHPWKVPESQSSRGAPYAVWISEVMSQQTRLQVVVEYFNKWVAEFPTVQHLADAPLDRVNELWAGLGYYRRARFLHEGAKQVVQRYDGEIPADVKTLLKLKGIGPYTAGAISSIAFGKREPLVDGNVERVFSRLLPALTSAQPSKSLSEEYWSIASACVQDIECAGDFNQALMEFGATVCKPKAVQCVSCPLRSMCGAYQEAIKQKVVNPAEYVIRYPIKDPSKATKVRKESVAALVVCAETGSGVKFLVYQRPHDGLLAGLWEAPCQVLKLGSTKEQDEAVAKLLSFLPEVVGQIKSGLLERMIAAPPNCEDVGVVKHVFSHIHQTLHVRLATIDANGCQPRKLGSGETKSGLKFRWLSKDELDDSAISTQMRKVFRAATDILERKN